MFHGFEAINRKSTFESVKKANGLWYYLSGSNHTNIPLSFVFSQSIHQKAMFESNPPALAKEPMNEVLTTKVTATQKQEFGLEAQQQGIDASTYLRKLIEVRHATLNMVSFEGIAIPCSSQFEQEFQQMSSEQRGEVEQLAAWILRTFLFSYQQQCRDANGVIPLTSVNLSYKSGFQTVTNVNGNVNGSIQRKTEENTFRVNAPKRLSEFITPIMVTMKIPLLLNNIERAKEYALEQAGRFSNMNEDTLDAIIFENFSEEEINLLHEISIID